MMSLLRCLRPRLPVPRRPIVVAAAGITRKSGMPGYTQDAFMDMINAGGKAGEERDVGEVLEEDEDEMPPLAPETAYPASRPPVANPLRAGKTAAEEGESQRSRSKTYGLYVRASKRNTIATFARPEGGVIRTYSGGSVGFKHGNRSSYEAGHQCAMHVLNKVREMVDYTGGRMEIHLYLSGFGNGREAMFHALMAPEAENIRQYIVRITDKTAIKIGGSRAKKARRL